MPNCNFILYVPSTIHNIVYRERVKLFLELCAPLGIKCLKSPMSAKWHAKDLQERSSKNVIALLSQSSSHSLWYKPPIKQFNIPPLLKNYSISLANGFRQCNLKMKYSSNMLAHVYNPIHGRLTQEEGCEFRDTLSYIIRLRPV